jgi:voltage-gated potassium channel
MNPIREAFIKIHFFHKISPTENKYLYLLFSVALFSLVAPFSSSSDLARFVNTVLLTIVIVSSLYAEYESKRVDYIEFALGFIAIILTWVNYYFHFIPYIDIVTLISYGCFFLYFIIELITRIVISTIVSMNLIYAAIVGFMSIALLGSVLAAIIHLIIPSAYNFHVDPQIHMFENYVYYSFITVTTVGYGDELPIQPASKMLAIFLSVTAHMYSTIVLGMIIGKFISAKNS